MGSEMCIRDRCIESYPRYGMILSEKMSSDVGEVYVLQSLRRRILIVRVGLYVGNRKTESADVRYEGVRKACHNHQRCLDPKNDYCHEQELPV